MALSPDELVHPYLAPVAAITAHWHGRESLHGGGIAVRGRVMGVVGDRLEGKSSLLAALAARGVDVVCDDMLVVEDDHAFAGPRTIDLREDAAGALGVGENIGVAGARARWRVRLGPAPPRLPLAGWIFLDWAERVEVARVPASETLQRLLRNRGIRVPPLDPAHVRSARRDAGLGGQAPTLVERGAGRRRRRARRGSRLSRDRPEPDRLEERMRPGSPFRPPPSDQRVDIDDVGVDAFSVPGRSKRAALLAPQRGGEDGLRAASRHLTR